MQKKRDLFSWIGHSDLLGMAGDATPTDQQRILEALKIERQIRKQDGPIKALLKQEAFEEVHLLSTYPPWMDDMYLEWLGFQASR